MKNMELRVDGEPMEANNVTIVLPRAIIGCSGAGGSHHEIMGRYEISIEDNSIEIRMIHDDDRENDEDCYASMNINDLAGEMHLTSIAIHNKNEIRHVRKLFHKL